VDTELIFFSLLLNRINTRNVCYYRFGVSQIVNLRLIMLAILAISILWQFHPMVPFVLLEERYVSVKLGVLLYKLLKNSGH
jgi:hypothetical protein